MEYTSTASKRKLDDGQEETEDDDEEKKRLQAIAPWKKQQLGMRSVPSYKMKKNETLVFVNLHITLADKFVRCGTREKYGYLNVVHCIRLASGKLSLIKPT